MAKVFRAGGKYTGNHTTLIPLAATACDIAHRLPEVTKITPGFISNSNSASRGTRRVKFTDESPRCILLSVREKSLHQEVRVYVTNIQEARTTIARRLRDADIPIRFMKD